VYFVVRPSGSPELVGVLNVGDGNCRYLELYNDSYSGGATLLNVYPLGESSQSLSAAAGSSPLFAFQLKTNKGETVRSDSPITVSIVDAAGNVALNGATVSDISPRPYLPMYEVSFPLLSNKGVYYVVFTSGSGKQSFGKLILNVS